jgi:hypothetical protein
MHIEEPHSGDSSLDVSSSSAQVIPLYVGMYLGCLVFDKLPSKPWSWSVVSEPMRILGSLLTDQLPIHSTMHITDSKCNIQGDSNEEIELLPLEHVAFICKA